jgi:alkylhydroperoxidase family enzyme
MARFADLVQRLKDSVLGSPGWMDPAIRRAIEARAAELGGRVGAQAGEVSVPEDLTEYVDKVALHAYTIREEDVEALKRAGYSEDGIFEVSVAAALGAGMSRLERGLSALKGGETR